MSVQIKARGKLPDAGRSGTAPARSRLWAMLSAAFARVRPTRRWRSAGAPILSACSLLLVLCFSSSLPAAAPATNAPPDPASSLLPPRGEILPTFWEQYGAWAMLGGASFLLAVAVVGWLVSRPKPPVPVPWGLQARRQLEPLSQKPEDGNLLSSVSQIVRHHIAAAFGLSPEETTTSEFCRTVVACQEIGPELAAALSEFLKECDLRKFSPVAPAAPLGAVSRSLKIIEKAEHRLAQLSLDAAADGNPRPARPSNERPEQRVASGA